MTAILALIDNSEKMRKYLFWYLMIIPALLFLWIAVGAANSQMSFQDAMKIPFFTVAFMNGCLSLLLGGTLKLAGIENERTERAYALYLIILLAVIGNLPGALLSFFLFRSCASVTWRVNWPPDTAGSCWRPWRFMSWWLWCSPWLISR